MKKSLLFITMSFAGLILASLFSSCLNSPLAKMQNIAKDAQENGSSWSEDEWKINSNDFQEAAIEFVKSNPAGEDLSAGNKAAEDFLQAASKSSLSTIGSIVGSMINSIQKYANTAIDEINDDENDFNIDDVSDAAENMNQKAINAAEKMNQDAIDAAEKMNQDAIDAAEEMMGGYSKEAVDEMRKAQKEAADEMRKAQKEAADEMRKAQKEAADEMRKAMER